MADHRKDEDRKLYKLFNNCQQQINFEKIADHLQEIIKNLNSIINDPSNNNQMVVKLRTESYKIELKRIKRLQTKEITDIFIDINKGSIVIAHISFHIVPYQRFIRAGESSEGSYHIKSDDNRYANAIGVSRDNKLIVSDITISSKFNTFDPSSNELFIARGICDLLNRKDIKKGGGEKKIILVVNFNIDNGSNIYYYSLKYNFNMNSLKTSEILVDIINNTYDEKNTNIINLKLSEENLLMILLILYIYVSYIKIIFESEKVELPVTRSIPIAIAGYYKKYLKYKAKYLKLKKLKYYNGI